MTASDSCAAGRREDISGPRCREILTGLGFTCTEVVVVPDDRELLAETLTRLSDDSRNRLVVTTGGTGLSPRDTTPEATRQVVEREVPGIGELLRMEGYRKNPRAVLSRAMAGIRGQTLIINLPGSVRGVTEGLEILAPILEHALDVIAGDVHRCGG